MNDQIKTPTNTAKADPFLNLLVAMDPGGSGIYAQEAQGQREMLASTTLPTDMGWSRPGEPEPQEKFEALGFTFGDVVEGDPLFRQATLPEGWGREATDHSMHTSIVDERGIRRVSVFYKAAFYDRKASMNIVNVGREVAQKYLYDYEDQGPFSPPEALTEDEVAEVLASATEMLLDIATHPDIYSEGGKEDKAKAIFAHYGQPVPEATDEMIQKARR